MGNKSIIQRLYAAFERGDVRAALAEMSETIEWNEAEHFVYSDRNPYTSPAAVAEGVFGRLVEHWEDYEAPVSTILEAEDDSVVALGRSKGVNRTTGKHMDAQFVHVWKVKEGKIVGFQQYIDTLQVNQAMSV